MTVAPANSVAGAGKEGVVVTEVDPKSAAAERGFKEGDVILEVGGKSASTAGERPDAREERRPVALRRRAPRQGLISAEAQTDNEMKGVAGIGRPSRRRPSREPAQRRALHPTF
ncbi:hypothetical protein E4T56_gene15175, partial [Termitomyces sp. T112]